MPTARASSAATSLEWTQGDHAYTTALRWHAINVDDDQTAATSPRQIVVLSDPFGASDTVAATLGESIIDAIVHAGIEALSYEPACESLIGSHFDRFLSTHAVAELGAVVARSTHPPNETETSIGEDDPLVELTDTAQPIVHLVGIGMGAMFAACASAAIGNLASLTMINPLTPTALIEGLRTDEIAADVTEGVKSNGATTSSSIVQQLRERLPLGLIETLDELDPIQCIAVNARPTLLVSAAGDPLGAAGVSAAFAAAIEQTDQPVWRETLPRTTSLDDPLDLGLIAGRIVAFVRAVAGSSAGAAV